MRAKAGTSPMVTLATAHPAKFPEAVEKAKMLGLPTIGPKTINGSYVTFAKAMFAWAVGEAGTIASTPTRSSGTLLSVPRPLSTTPPCRRLVSISARAWHEKAEMLKC